MIILIISQIFNNNVLLVEDEKNQEKIIWGRGIGFKAHSGQNYSLQAHDKVFELIEDRSDKFLDSVKLTFESIPKECFKIAKQIVILAKKEENLLFDEKVFLVLAYYIDFALTKGKSALNPFDPLLFELKTLFSQEYKISKKAQYIIKKNTGVLISEDDVATISVILIKNEIKKSLAVQKLNNMLEISNSVTKIIENVFRQKIPKNNVSLMMLKKYLCYLIFHLHTNSKYTNLTINTGLLYKVIRKNPQAGICLKRITTYLEKKINYHFNNLECFFILIHIIDITE